MSTPTPAPYFYWGEGTSCPTDVIRFELVKTFTQSVRSDGSIWLIGSINILPSPHARTPKLQKARAYGIKAKGTFPRIQNGQIYEAEATMIWDDYSKLAQYHCWSVVLENIKPAALDDTGTIERFIRRIPGIGEKYANRIVKALGMDTIRVLKEDPKRICTLIKRDPESESGQEMIAALPKLMARFDVDSVLERHGVNGPTINRIYKYTTHPQEHVAGNPFDLVNVEGVSYASAYGIGMEWGKHWRDSTKPISADDPRVLDFALYRAVVEIEKEGHVYSPTEIVCQMAESVSKDIAGVYNQYCAFLYNQPTDSEEALWAEKARNLLHTLTYRDESGDIWAARNYMYETQIADKLAELAHRPALWPNDRIEAAAAKVLARYTKKKQRLPSEDQVAHVLTLLKRRVGVLDGGAGSGKTTATLFMYDVLTELKIAVLMAAPTGKAARRICEITGHDGRTIHRHTGAGIGGGAPSKTRNSPFEAAVVIADESGMYSDYLAWLITQPVNEARGCIYFVGDTNQLKPVQGGDFLPELIAASREVAEAQREMITDPELLAKKVYEEIPVTTLTTIFRQESPGGEVSQLIDVCYGALYGYDPREDHLEYVNGASHRVRGKPLDDNVIFIDTSDIEAIRVKVAEIVRAYGASEVPLPVRKGIIESIPPILNYKYGDGCKFDPVTGIEIGDACIVDLNTVVQREVNPPHRDLEELKLAHTLYRVGDRLNWTKNLYNLELYQDAELMNGQEVYLRGINDDDPEIGRVYEVQDGAGENSALLRIKPDEFAAALGYSISAHKFQGSESDWGIVIAHPSGYISRAWWYTALTRFKKGVIVIGDTKKIFRGHTKDQNRRTKLKEFIVEKLRRPQEVL